MLDQPTGDLVRFAKNDIVKSNWSEIFKFRQDQLNRDYANFSHPDEIKKYINIDNLK